MCTRSPLLQELVQEALDAHADEQDGTGRSPKVRSQQQTSQGIRSRSTDGSLRRVWLRAAM